MKLLFLVFLLVGILAWTKEDYEIFNINDLVSKDLGSNATFYSWLNLPKGPKSSYLEISKAYRKLLRTLHPDKFRGNNIDKNLIEERFQRLSVVGNILKDASLKQRYDYFLAKGFPKWKGTGFFYSKYRPSFIGTIFGLFLLISLVHYIALKINRSQDFNRLSELKSKLISTAGTNSGSDHRVSSGDKSFIVKPDCSVFLESGQDLIELDENDINLSPTLKESLLFKFPAFLWNKSFGSWLNYHISTDIVFNKKITLVDPPKKNLKKKKAKGERKELENGKVVYSRKR